MHGPNKLECYIALVWNGLPVTTPLAYQAYLQVIKKMKGLIIRPQICMFCIFKISFTFSNFAFNDYSHIYLISTWHVLRHVLHQ
jgi:hypothetical protein